MRPEATAALPCVGPRRLPQAPDLGPGGLRPDRRRPPTDHPPVQVLGAAGRVRPLFGDAAYPVDGIAAPLGRACVGPTPYLAVWRYAVDADVARFWPKPASGTLDTARKFRACRSLSWMGRGTGRRRPPVERPGLFGADISGSLFGPAGRVCRRWPGTVRGAPRRWCSGGQLTLAFKRRRCPFLLVCLPHHLPRSDGGLHS